MKKRIIALITLLMLALTGCGNYDMIDNTYAFDRAIIQLQTGEIIEGKVDSWTDYEDGDQIQVKIDGVTYLVHISNATLIAE